MLLAICYLLTAVCLSFMMSISVFAATIEDIQILKISPVDERAVIKTPDGKMGIIKTGDLLHVTGSELRVVGEKKQKSAAGYELRVVEITKGRIVFEEKTDKGIETVIIRLEGGKQRVERIRKTGEKQPVPYAPIHEGRK